MSHRLVNGIRYRQMLVSPHIGGGAKLAMSIHRYAVSTRGPVSDLWIPGGGEAERHASREQFPFAHYRVDRLTGTRRWTSILENLSLWRRHASRGTDVIHIHAPFVYGAARPFFKLARLKTVLHIHLDFSANDLRWALKSPPDRIIVCADFMRPAVEEALRSQGADTRTIRVIRNAIDVQAFEQGERAGAKARLGVDSERPLLMVVANLAPHKGQATAIKAAALLKARGRDVNLWIVGTERSDGKGHLGELQHLAQERGVADRVTFAGFRTDVPALLKAADFLLLPSTSEGLPLVVLEAQASGALVLAAPTAGVPEVVQDGHTGYLIGADDADGYAARIEALLSSPTEARQILDNASRHVREHHDTRSYCERVIAVYEELREGAST